MKCCQAFSLLLCFVTWCDALSTNPSHHRDVIARQRTTRKSLRRRCRTRPDPVPVSLSGSVVASVSQSAHSTLAPSTSQAGPAPHPTQPASQSSPPASHPSSNPPATTSIPGPSNGHKFTLTNRCSGPITPRFGDTKCGYSPRCSDAASFSAPQPATLAPGASTALFVDKNWVGRIWAKTPRCGPVGENCTMLEFNLDTGSQFTPQAYDISNIQGFTQAVSVGAVGCETVACSSPTCACKQAYRIGDLSGCGADLPVRACGAGPVALNVVFCP